MASKTLEFRGIPVKHLEMYFEELGAAKSPAQSLPFHYNTASWQVEILSEQILEFTSNFKVNAVKICFEAKDELLLEDLIKNFRYKTTRVGG